MSAVTGTLAEELENRIAPMHRNPYRPVLPSPIRGLKRSRPWSLPPMRERAEDAHASLVNPTWEPIDAKDTDLALAA
jgi:hypothetical protein